MKVEVKTQFDYTNIVDYNLVNSLEIDMNHVSCIMVFIFICKCQKRDIDNLELAKQNSGLLNLKPQFQLVNELQKIDANLPT